MKYNSQAKFRDYAAAMKAVKQAKVENYVIYGSSQFLIQRSIGLLKSQRNLKNRKHIFHDACDLSDIALSDMFQSSPGLFESRHCHTIQRCDKNTKIFEKNSFLPKDTASNSAILCFNSMKISKKIIENLQSAYFIPCVAPTARDLPMYVKNLAREYKIALNPDATHLLLECLGTDLSKISNEIKTLALIFPPQDEKDRPLTTDEIRKFLTFIREDHAFEMEKLLLKKQQGKAILLLTSLLDKGDSPMAILGILSQHCRKALFIIEGSKKGVGQQELAQGLKVPAFVVNQYIQQISKLSSVRYRSCLNLCQEVDVMLKSSSSDKINQLYRIINHLTA